LLAVAELADEVAAAVAGRAGRDALTAFAGAYRDYAKRHPGRYAAARLKLDPETAAAGAGPRHAEMTRAILRGYALGEPDQTDAVRMLGAVFHGFVGLETAGAFGHHPRAVDASWERALDALHPALTTWPPPCPAQAFPPSRCWAGRLAVQTRPVPGVRGGHRGRGEGRPRRRVGRRDGGHSAARRAPC